MRKSKTIPRYYESHGKFYKEDTCRAKPLNRKLKGLQLLDDATLMDRLLYNPLSGGFTWARFVEGRRPGQIAGIKSKTDGHLYIRLKGILYRAEDLAWLYQEGTLPTHTIHHFDQNPTHNEFDNLYPGTHEHAQDYWKTYNLKIMP